MTRKDVCPSFFCQDTRFSYEADGCGPCVNRRKPLPTGSPILSPLRPTYEKCLKNHMVKIYTFREEALQEPLKKETQFVVAIKLPKRVSRQQVKDTIEAAIESEVLILMEGKGTLGAGYLDSDFLGFDEELDALGFGSQEEKKKDESK